MARAASRPSLWPILLFFLVGAAGAIVWDLRHKAAVPGEVAIGSAGKAAIESKRPVTRGSRAARAPKSRATASAPKRAPNPPRLQNVGIPMESVGRARASSPDELSAEQAEKILRNLVATRQYYGISPDCLWTRPLGYRNGSHEFEIVAAGCESIARGSVIARWRVNATTGEASFRNSRDVFEPAP